MEVPKRLFPMLFVGVGAALYFSLAPSWPSDQHFRIVLGDLAQRTEEVSVRCGQKDGEWAREVTFRYALGQAPRIVSYEPRLASGEYLVQIEVETDDGHRETQDRHIQLAGGTTSIDLSVGPRAR